MYVFVYVCVSVCVCEVLVLPNKGNTKVEIPLNKETN